MAAITLQLPDELASRLRAHEDRLPEILELGLRRLTGEHSGSSPCLEEASSIVEFLAGQPPPEEILQLKGSERLERRVEELLEKNRSSGLNPEEEEEWERYELMQHLVTLAKTQAHIEFSGRTGNA